MRSAGLTQPESFHDLVSPHNEADTPVVSNAGWYSTEQKLHGPSGRLPSCVTDIHLKGTNNSSQQNDLFESHLHVFIINLWNVQQYKSQIGVQLQPSKMQPNNQNLQTRASKRLNYQPPLPAKTIILISNLALSIQ